MAHIPHIPVVSHHHYGHSRPMTDTDIKVIICFAIFCFSLSLLIFGIFLIQEKFNFKYAANRFFSSDQPILALIINFFSAVLIFFGVLVFAVSFIYSIIFS